jgi:CPA1 family monovalent cation:H+ antiporter
MEAFLSAETVIIELLLVASLVAIAVRRLRVPYTVALVIAGLLLTTQQPIDVALAPELILALLVPPLIFEAAFHINLRELQRNVPNILLLAIPGVVISMLIVGTIVTVTTPLALPVALVFGALISATDPVAVVALFRALGAPRRLSLLMEGESLFNDGTAIVVFNVVLAVALTGHFSLLESVGDFVRVVAGGLVIGLGLGWITARVIANIDDYLIETTLTTVVAFGSYLVGERLHFSGVLAVVAAGIVCGNLGTRGMSPTTRIVLFNFWEYVAFLANSFVFLLVGLQVNIPILISHWQPIVWAIVAALVARALVVYGLGWLGNQITDPIPLRWLHVLNWGGLRGAIALALALTLPTSLGADRELVQVMAFGVVLFTLLVQSTTMGRLLRRLGILTRNALRSDYELKHARLLSLRYAAEHLDEMYRSGFVSEQAWEALRPELLQDTETLAETVKELQRTHPELAEEELHDARRELLRAQRGALMTLRRDGIISQDALEALTVELDAGLYADGYEKLSPDRDMSLEEDLAAVEDEAEPPPA